MKTKREKLCDECGKRPATFVRYVGKYRGLKSKFRIRADKNHTLCQQCHNEEFEAIKQRGLGDEISDI